MGLGDSSQVWFLMIVEVAVLHKERRGTVRVIGYNINWGKLNIKNEFT